MSIAQSILDIVVAAAEKERARRITRINMIAGELRGIVPMQLTFCFGVLAENTIASGAHLNLEILPVEGKCRECGGIFRVVDFLYICPHCGSSNMEVTAGTELRVKDIEVE